MCEKPVFSKSHLYSVETHEENTIGTRVLFVSALSISEAQEKTLIWYEQQGIRNIEIVASQREKNIIIT